MPGKGQDIESFFSVSVQYVSLNEIIEKTGLEMEEIRKRLMRRGMKAKIIGEDGNRAIFYEATQQFYEAFPELSAIKKRVGKRPEENLAEAQGAAEHAPVKGGAYIFKKDAQEYILRRIESAGVTKEKAECFARIIISDISGNVSVSERGITTRFVRAELEEVIDEWVRTIRKGTQKIYNPCDGNKNGAVCYGLSYPSHFNEKESAIQFLYEFLDNRGIDGHEFYLDNSEEMNQILTHSLSGKGKGYSRATMELLLHRHLKYANKAPSKRKRGRRARREEDAESELLAESLDELPAGDELEQLVKKVTRD